MLPTIGNVLSTQITYEVGFEVLAVAVTNNAIFWDITLYSPYGKRCFRGTHHFHLQGRKEGEQVPSMRHI
jgi:hypothetical protein